MRETLFDWPSARLSPRQRITNPCGTCTECCTKLAVEELSKDVGVRCEHLHSHGCKIYRRRPESCQGYTCVYRSWLMDGNQVPIALRPDKCHVVIDYMPTTKSHYVRVTKEYEDAWMLPPVINVMLGLVLNDEAVVLMVDGTPRGALDPEKVRNVAKKAGI